MFHPYRVHELDGSDAGETLYAVMIQPGETIVLGAGPRCIRVVVNASRSDRAARREGAEAGVSSP